MNDSDLSWYRRHETERCECGHERREHPRQPFTVPDTPGCTGVVDYGGDCACPRFRFAHELDPAPGPLDGSPFPFDALEPEPVMVRICPNCEHPLHEAGCTRCDCETTRPKNVPAWMPVPEYHRPWQIRVRATGPGPNDDWFSIYKTTHQSADPPGPAPTSSPAWLCLCGHPRSAHVYHEGPCRPGFVCEEACTRYVAEENARVGGSLARDLEPDVRAWEAEIAADRELFIAQMLREGIE